MARVAIRVFGVGGADTNRIDEILLFTIMKFYIHYRKKELAHKIMSSFFFYFTTVKFNERYRQHFGKKTR